MTNRPIHAVGLLWAAVAVVVSAAAGTTAAVAGEPAREYLEALRERKYFDTAVEYLDLMADSPLATVELKQSLTYEKAVVLIEGSRQQRDPALREKTLEEAKSLLEQFVAQFGDHAKANAARNQLGSLVAERARNLLEESKKTKQESQKLQAKALYQEAFDVFQSLQTNVRENLERIPKVLDTSDKIQAAMADRREQLRADYLQTQLLAGVIREEMSDTVAPGSDEQKKMLGEAAALYEDIYKKYRLKIAGYYARMYQGRANQKMGKLTDALGFFTEILDQDEEAFRSLKTKTLRQALECWLDPSQKKYVEAIKRGTEWLAQARPNEDADVDWLAIRMSIAKAYQMQAEADGEGAGAKSLKEARSLVQFVAKHPSQFQEEAQKLIATLGGPQRKAGEKVVPTNFQEARDAGKDALDSISPAQLITNEVPKRLAAEQDADAKAELQKQLDAAQQTLATAQTDALEYFQTALRLVNKESPLEEINVVRYYLCYLYFLEKEFQRAALLGEFVAQRYPDSAGARQCAKIALASYLQLYAEGETTGGPEARAALGFEADRVMAVARYTADKWPDQPEAEESLAALIPFLLNANDVAGAEAALAKFPENSRRRIDAQMKIGMRLWGNYLAGTAELAKVAQSGTADGADPAARRAALDADREKVKQYLSVVFAALGEQPKVSSEAAKAVLSLAQAYTASKQVAEALRVLETPQHGLIALLDADHEGFQDPRVAEEGYKTALNAYVASLATATDTAAAISKASDVMTKMTAAVGEDEAGKQRLIAIYVSMARDLENQMREATPEARKTLSAGFETFLTQLAAGSTELGVLNWVAETFASLGRGSMNGDQITDDAKAYLQKSLDAFQSIQDKVKLTDQQKTQISFKMAAVQRDMGNYQAALDVFAQVLKASPMMLTVQVEAAKTLQQWGMTKGNEAKLLEAIGGVKNPAGGQPIIWGWGKIGNTTFQRRDQFNDVFHESRLSLAKCRKAYAASAGANKATELTKAENEILQIKRMVPDLGGEAWTRQYDALLKEIQQANGKPAVGLQGL